MRLLNTESLKLEEFIGRKVPTYAILSHTWGDKEVILQDMQAPEAEKKAGYSKLRGCCARAANDGFEYVWIDTCCIDKTSSAELSEAINSMYRWYRNARICYAYLVDIPTGDSVKNPSGGGVWDRQGTFRCSRWFTRGWTLQELIAPRIVEFYAEDWSEIGTKSSLREEIASITGIDVQVLDGADPSTCNVAERMSWAACRQTTRTEDAAYSLLGVFQVCMPLLYGEGRRAFLRLQEEILKMTEDYTLLAWKSYPGSNLRPTFDSRLGVTEGPLASDVSEFKIPDHNSWKYSRLEIDKGLEETSYLIAPQSPSMLTARGLQISLPLLKITEKTYLAYLRCKQSKTSDLLCMSLTPIRHEPGRYKRLLSGNSGYQFLSASRRSSFEMATIYIQQTPVPDVDLPLLAHTDVKFYVTVNSCAFNDTCTVNTNWGERSSKFPWASKVRTWEETPWWPEVAFIFQTGDTLLVKFGIHSSTPWCDIIIEPEFPGAGRSWEQVWKSLPDFGWELHVNYVPKIRRDRATKFLPSNLGEICVSIRAQGARMQENPDLLVDISIKQS